MKIEIKNIFPAKQCDTSRDFSRSCDCYYQRFMKFPLIGVFHSHAELLHAALLEANHEVISFVPQPFKLHVNGKRYIPDCFIAYKNKHEVIELKPRGEFDDDKKIPLQERFKNEYGYEFKVISNESVFEEEVKANNWLFIIRTLSNVDEISTTNQEQDLLEKFFHKPKQQLGDVVKLNNRMNAYLDELALFRLIHKGKLNISNEKQLDLDTEVTSCI